MKFLEYFVLGFILMCLVVYYEKFHTEMVNIKSKIDNESYIVRNLPDKQEAADTLAKMRTSMIDLVDHVHNEDVKSKQDRFCKKSIDILKSRFKPEMVSESPADAKYTSYSVNKGEKIFFCLRLKDDDSNKIIDVNTLKFVAIHELAHVMTYSIGHTGEFWSNFRFLLRQAVKSNIYKYQKFSENPIKYCGMMITDTPYKPERDNDPKIFKEENKTKSCR